MKVKLLVNSLSDGGAEKVAVELLNGFAQRNWEANLVTLDDRDNFFDLNHLGRPENLSTHKKGLMSLLQLFYQAYKLARLTSKEDVVQSHLVRSHYVNVLAKLFFGAKHCVQLVHHSNYDRFSFEGLKGIAHLTLIKIFFPKSDSNIFVSRYSMKCLPFLEKLPRSEVVYNPIDAERVSSLAEAPLTDFPTNKDKHYLVMVCRLNKVKRIKDAIVALYFLPSNVEIIIVGEGDEKSHLSKLVDKMKLTRRVHFVGWKANPFNYMARASILLSCSSSESFGNSILEAFICGVPVISSRSGGPEELLESGRGQLYDVGHVFQLVTCIEKFIYNRVLSDKCRQLAFDSIKTFYNKDTTLCQYEASIRRLSRS